LAVGVAALTQVLKGVAGVGRQEIDQVGGGEEDDDRHEEPSNHISQHLCLLILFEELTCTSAHRVFPGRWPSSGGWEHIASHPHQGSTGGGSVAVEGPVPQPGGFATKKVGASPLTMTRPPPEEGSVSC